MYDDRSIIQELIDNGNRAEGPRSFPGLVDGEIEKIIDARRKGE